MVAMLIIFKHNCTITINEKLLNKLIIIIIMSLSNLFFENFFLDKHYSLS